MFQWTTEGLCLRFGISVPNLFCLIQSCFMLSSRWHLLSSIGWRIWPWQLLFSRTKVEPEPLKLESSNRGFEDKTSRRENVDLSSATDVSNSFVANDSVVIADVQIDQVVAGSSAFGERGKLVDWILLYSKPDLKTTTFIVSAHFFTLN